MALLGLREGYMKKSCFSMLVGQHGYCAILFERKIGQHVKNLPRRAHQS